eukprot:NODE_211_length_1169_cov_479.371401_g206_i0.p1 GENE.NODE_211_length_1169_cov_479.371401_g206_i0~~NODE_211_length_1169_cov_479.371401_g206_i0.p1  ORF type:complete len:283 (+),score=84.45 NODE_211_length_1169_cov_479.371401_g206_i0:187-1035(+)
MAACKMVQVTEEHAKKHYEDLAKKPFYSDLCKFICSGPMVAMVWEGLDACKTGRSLLGETNPADSKPGTIRGDFAVDIGRNVCHGSDGVESAKKEIALWFKPGEIVSWTPCQQSWVYELPAGAPASSSAPAKKAAPAGKKIGTLEITVDKANMKNSDQVAKLDPLVKLKLGTEECQTKQLKSTLTPMWDETFQMDVYNLQDRLIVTAFLGENEAGEGYLLLDSLIQGKSTFKGVAVKGGKLDLTLKALDFGQEAKAEEDSGDWMDFCGEDGEMGGMDDSDED